MKKQIDMIVMLVVAFLLFTKPTVLVNFANSIVGRFVLVGAILFAFLHSTLAGLFIVILFVLLSEEASEGFENQVGVDDFTIQLARQNTMQKTNCVQPLRQVGWTGTDEVVDSGSYPDCELKCQENPNCGAIRWVNASKDCDLLKNINAQQNDDPRWSWKKVTLANNQYVDSEGNEMSLEEIQAKMPYHFTNGVCNPCADALEKDGICPFKITADIEQFTTMDSLRKPVSGKQYIPDRAGNAKKDKDKKNI